MRRNCNLELQLFPQLDSGPGHGRRPNVEEEANESPQQEYKQQQQQEQQKLTIFYDGKICVCDVTEFQARTILMLANKEMDEKVRTPNGTSEPCSPLLQSNHQLYSPSTALSMKRSLQHFLQKRKNRMQEASPYHH